MGHHKCGCGCHWDKHHGCHGSSHEKEMMKFNSGDMMTDWFVEKADDAWAELFMEKAKAHWEKVHGADIDKFAEESVKASFENHGGMMDSQKNKQMAVKKMHELMS